MAVLSAMPGTDTKGATALVMSATKGNDPVKWCATHMNMKLPPDQLDTRKGRDSVMNLVRTLFENGGYHIQFNVLDTEKLRDAQKHPENYRDLVVRVAGFSAFFTNCTRACRTKSSSGPSEVWVTFNLNKSSASAAVYLSLRRVACQRHPVYTSIWS